MKANNPYRTPDPPPVDPGPTWWERNGDDVRALAIAFGVMVAFGGILFECHRETKIQDAEEAEIQKDPARDCERFRDRTTAGTPMRCLKHFGVAR